MLPLGSPGAGGVGEEATGTGRREGTPSPRTVWCVLGRRGAVRTASSDSDLGDGVCPSALASSPPASFPSFSRVNIAPPTPHPTEAHTLPLRGPREEARGARESGEGGSSAAFPAG